jgi:hypothetical protein
MADKTGLEVLAELVEQVKLLSKKVDVIDLNVKTLMNRIQIPKQDVVDRPRIPAKLTETKPKAQEYVPKPKTKEKPSGAMVSSKVVIMDGETPTPIPEALIKIYDETDQVVKDTKTNRAGVWMAQLKPGRYVVEIGGWFKGKALIPQNKNFIVPPNVQEYEVI